MKYAVWAYLIASPEKHIGLPVLEEIWNALQLAKVNTVFTPPILTGSQPT